MSKNKNEIPLDFWLAYTVEEMKSLPDPFTKPMVLEGVEIKIALSNMWGGWTLAEDGPKVVWFIFVQHRKVEKLISAL